MNKHLPHPICWTNCFFRFWCSHVSFYSLIAITSPKICVWSPIVFIECTWKSALECIYFIFIVTQLLLFQEAHVDRNCHKAGNWVTREKKRVKLKKKNVMTETHNWVSSKSKGKTDKALYWLICTQQCVLIRGMWVLNEVLSSLEQ